MVQNFFRRITYSTVELIRGYNTLKCLNELKESQWLSKDEIKKLQWKRLENLLKCSYKNVPYYKKLFDNLDIKVGNGITLKEFQKIPLLDKEKINKNIEEIKSTSYKPSNMTKNTTSGSTGEKLIFYTGKKRPNNNFYMEAAVLRNREWTGANIWDKQVHLWGAHMDISKSKKIKGRIMNFIFSTLILSTYNMDKETLNNYAEKINQYQPKILTGYASALYLFADFLDKSNIKINCLKGIISSAEVLYQHQRDKIESVFNCKVFNRYGCREFGTIAHECKEQNGLHINSEHVYVEILDENGKPCKPGDKGEIVVTDLDNYAFPFIRYKIGDLSALSGENCTCGRGLPLLVKVEGRVWDIIVGKNNNRIVGTFWLVYGIDGIKQFQVIQEKLGEIIVKLVVDDSFKEKEKQLLLKRIYDKCGKDMIVDLQFVEDIPISESGKHRFIISKVSPFVIRNNEKI